MNDEKNYMDGIKPPAQKRSIKDIPMPPRKRVRSTSTAIKKETQKNLDLRDEGTISEQESVSPLKPVRSSEAPYSLNVRQGNFPDSENDEEDYDSPKVKSNQGERKSKIVPIAVTASIIVGLFLIFVVGSSILSGATITINPKSADLANLNVSLPVVNENTGNQNLLNYKVLEISDSSSKEVSSEKEEAVENKASGVITVYNEYSAEVQKLIQNTRFESPDGLVYRIKDSITVPGYTESGGKKTPGKIDVEVFADKAGDSYNIGVTDFKIPGFKDQPQYDSFYAKSKTEMAGGFIGTKNTVSAETLSTISKELQGDITNKILAKIEEQVTDKYVYVYSPDQFKFQEAKQDNSSGKKVSVSLNGTAYVYVFDTLALSQKVAEKEISDYSNDAVLIQDIKALSIKLETNSVESDDEVLQNNEVITLNGNAKIVWQNDVEKIKSDLASKNKKELPEIMSNYPGVVTAEVVITPFWESSLPKNTDKIEVKISE